MLVVLNPASGGEEKESVAERIERQFAAHGVTARIARANTPAELVELARQGVRERAPAVVAAGGDGTVSAVASALAGTGVPLGVLPVGTLNHFARDLRVPPSVDAAIGIIAAGRVAQLDICEVNGHTFVNNSSLGLYPELVEQRESREKEGYSRWAAFAWAAAMALRRYPAPVVRLEADGKDLLRRAPVLFIGNNVYETAGLRIGMRRSLSAGVMCVYVLHRAGRLSLLRLAATALAGRLRAARDFDALCARELWIDSRRPLLRVALDGEVVNLAPPLHYLVRPRALSVLVPGD